MEKYRRIVQIVRGKNTSDGAGVKLVRVFGYRNTADFDPFLMMDAFDNDQEEDYIRGFPWHPHRGIETVTYLIEGRVEHGDSLGNSGVIGSGDCQWMTAGSGIIHQEMPKGPGRMRGVQLWLNLPAKDKMTEPAYGDILAADIPCVRENSAGTTGEEGAGAEIIEIRVISGRYRDVNGAFEGRYLKPLFLDVKLPPNTVWELETEPTENTVYSYNFNGSGWFGDAVGNVCDIRDAAGVEDEVRGGNDEIGEKITLLFGPGKKFRVKSGEDGLRFILLSGLKLAEPVAWGGPIVMNTKQELDLAFRELDEKTFIKHRISEVEARPECQRNC